MEPDWLDLIQFVFHLVVSVGPGAAVLCGAESPRHTAPPYFTLVNQTKHFIGLLIQTVEFYVENLILQFLIR